MYLKIYNKNIERNFEEKITCRHSNSVGEKLSCLDIKTFVIIKHFLLVD